MISIPCRTHILTDSALRAWAQTRSPREAATSTQAATSASVITVASARAEGVNSSPEMLSFRRSTPSRTSRRQSRRTSSGPSATQLNVGFGW